MCVSTHSLNWIRFLLWTLTDSFIWIGIVHVILFDISRWYHHVWCILYTSKVIKSGALHILTRIAWCFMLSYLISELRMDGLWACPQLSSYSWWGCEYNTYHCWQNYTFNLLGEVDVYELYYWLASWFNRASHRCSSYSLSLGALGLLANLK